MLQDWQETKLILQVLRCCSYFFVPHENMRFFKIDQFWLKFFRTFRKIPAKLLIDNLTISHTYHISLNRQLRVLQNAQQRNNSFSKAKFSWKKVLQKDCGRTQFIQIYSTAYDQQQLQSKEMQERPQTSTLQNRKFRIGVEVLRLKNLKKQISSWKLKNLAPYRLPVQR